MTLNKETNQPTKLWLYEFKELFLFDNNHLLAHIYKF